MKKKEREKETERWRKRESQARKMRRVSQRDTALFLLFRWSPVARAQPVNIKGCCTCLQQHCVVFAYCAATCLRRDFIVHRARALQLSPFVGKMDISRKSTH